MATERASLGSFLVVSPVLSSRTGARPLRWHVEDLLAGRDQLLGQQIANPPGSSTSPPFCPDPERCSDTSHDGPLLYATVRLLQLPKLMALAAAAVVRFRGRRSGEPGRLRRFAGGGRIRGGGRDAGGVGGPGWATGWVGGFAGPGVGVVG